MSHPRIPNKASIIKALYFFSSLKNVTTVNANPTITNTAIHIRQTIKGAYEAMTIYYIFESQKQKYLYLVWG